ncbi:LytR/AlgR family response regulator transcription factor [uncultured Hymenobacter sp.]|uniref:LytR/AlgR family response regulator transcription factor n=1 Tax=uncultured Hymenobacter sp. TaxID=170016 RepID=UPI0035C96320
MLTCFILDDEPAAIEILRTFIAMVPFLTLAGSATNPVEALGAVERAPVDLIFLDIHMPQLSGLAFMRLLPASTSVILTTAYAEFAVQGFELEALDYLLKPIAFERFLKAVQKVPRAGGPAGPPARELASEAADDYVFVKAESKGRLIRVAFNEIIYVEGLKNRITIATVDEQIVTLLSMKDLLARLPSRRFVRVHKSYFVALDKIRAVDGSQIFFQQSKAYVPLGEAYRTAFFQALQGKVMDGRK